MLLNLKRGETGNTKTWPNERAILRLLDNPLVGSSALFGVSVVAWLYGFSSLFTAKRSSRFSLQVVIGYLLCIAT